MRAILVCMETWRVHIFYIKMKHEHQITQRLISTCKMTLFQPTLMPNNIKSVNFQSITMHVR